METKSSTIAVATRLSINDLAKLYESLISRGISPDHIPNISQLLRMTVFITIADNTKDFSALPSDDAINAINRIIGDKSN